MDVPFAAQLYLDGAWTTVSAHTDDPARITGGRQKNAAVADPTRCSMKLRNNNGALSARNPRGPWFGLLGRAVPARAIVPDPTHMWITASGDIASTPDHASLDIVGDLDVRIDLEPITWDTNSILSLCGKYAAAGEQRSWAMWTRALKPTFRWTTGGTLASAITVEATADIVPAGSGRCAIRATLDVDNGASGWTVTFYTAPTLAGPWTQLGAPVTGAGVTSVFSGSAPIRIGLTDITSGPGTGRYHALQVRSGIGGTVVANPNFTAQTAGATSFADSAGRTWTLGGGAELRDFDVRASGEIADWPTRWVTSGRHRWANVEIAGWLRRLQQPSAPLRSPLYREATAVNNLTNMVGYWPMEDGGDAKSLASGLPGGTAATFTGEPSLSSSDRIPGSAPLLEMAAGVTITAIPSPHTPTGVIAMRMVADVPATGWAADAVVAEMRVSGGSVARWVLEVSNVGGLRVRGLDVEDAQVVNGGDIGFDIFQRRQMIGWQVSQVGSDVYWQIFARRINADLTVTEVGFDGTFAGRTVGRLTRARIAPAQNLDGGAVGHLMVGTSASLAAGIAAAIVGNEGETAGRRIIRLGVELSIPVRIIGDPDDTERMGPQQPGRALELFAACANADRGILSEPRDAMVLEYRTRMSIYNQVPRASLVYDTEGESPHLEPDEPVEDVCNDYTAERLGGSSYQARETTGRLSVAEYPAGVGPRPAGDVLNLETDEQLPAAAWWETHLGTWDDYRYPVIRIPLDRLVDAGKPELARGVAAARPGDRLVIANPPPDCPPDPIEAQMQGWVETIRAKYRRDISFNTMPHGPWVVGAAGVDLVDSDGTTLVSGLSAVTPGTSQAVSVNVAGVPWPTDAAFPFVMWLLTAGGAKAERVTATAVAGASSPQTMTITRGLDGYTRAHNAGAALILYRPLRWAR